MKQCDELSNTKKNKYDFTKNYGCLVNRKQASIFLSLLHATKKSFSFQILLLDSLSYFLSVQACNLSHLGIFVKLEKCHVPYMFSFEKQLHGVEGTNIHKGAEQPQHYFLKLNKHFAN